MKNKFLITFLFILSVSIPQISHAQLGFGGRIVMMHECFCSGGWMLYIMSPATGVTLPIVFQFGVSRLNAYWNIFTPGNNVVGTYIPGGACTLASTSCTVTIPAVGTITPAPFSGVGTSAFPI